MAEVLSKLWAVGVLFVGVGLGYSGQDLFALVNILKEIKTENIVQQNKGGLIAVSRRLYWKGNM